MRLYLRAVAYYRKDWPLIAAWLALTLSASALGLCAAWPMAVMVDTVLGSPGRKIGAHRAILSLLPHGRVGQIAGLAVFGLLIKFGQDLLGAAQTVVCNQVNYNGLMRVRCDLYRKFQILGLSYHRAQPQGDAIYRLTSDTFGCQTILSVILSTIIACLTLSAMGVVLACRNIPLTVLAFSIAPFLALANVTFGRRLKARSLACRQRDSELTTSVQRALNCIGLVQAFGREAAEFQQYRGSLRQTIHAWWALNREQIAYNLLIGTLFGVGGAVMFGYGGWLVYEGRLALGDLLIFTSYLGLVWGPLCTLTGSGASLADGVAGAQRVFEVLDRESQIADMPDALPLPRQPRTLELDGVHFGYAPGSAVLNGVSAVIRPGEMVAFVGASGAGKSTLLNLLPRFYDPTGGALRWDGIDARDIQLADLRSHVALVLQENAILPATVADNIAYGRPTATREQIDQAARLAGAASFIADLADGYDTPLNEGGSNLSGGQRQRIAIARALLTEAPVIILDEPTSALDAAHEQLIVDTLERIRGQRTIILVSHRMSAVRNCDTLYVLRDGEVAESGTPSALMRKQGLYAKMATQQMQASGPVLELAA